MVKIRLRPSRRSTQNNHNHQIPLLQPSTSSQDQVPPSDNHIHTHTVANTGTHVNTNTITAARPNTSDTENTNTFVVAASTHNNHNNHNNNNSPLRNIPDNSNTSNSNHPRRSKTTAQKVLKILDSPRRALVRNTNRSTKKKSKQTKTFNMNTLQTNNMNHKTNGDHSASINLEGMEIDFETQEYNAHHSTLKPAPSTPSNETRPNVMTWLHDEAPQDIIPKVMSFLGPQKHQVISRVSKSWRNICLSEGIFRTLCEDYGKWEPDKHTEPMVDCDYDHDCDGDAKMKAMETHEDDTVTCTFWRDFYCQNPIVPLDYPTLKGAVNATGHYVERFHIYEFQRSIRILLTPGVHILDDSIRVHMFRDSVFTVETLEPTIRFKNPSSTATANDNSNTLSTSFSASSTNSDALSTSSSSPLRSTSINGDNTILPRRRSSDRSRRNIFSCRSISGAEEPEEQDTFQPQTPLGSFSAFETSLYPYLAGGPKQAAIAIITKTLNSPIFHVTQGTLKLSNLKMVHNCNGVDIWNGNTVVQVQPKFIQNRPVLPKPGDKMPNAIIEDSYLTSISGRGVVAIDGGHSTIEKCCISNCAATGIYVGGPGSTTIAYASDIIRNGFGNERNRRGIARGHSGVYLEQGTASLMNCNISNNSLTGISAISQTNAILTVRDSDLAGNGTTQLEMPPAGSISRQQSVSENNTLSRTGMGRSRLGSNSEEQNGSRSLDSIQRRIQSPPVNNGRFNLPPRSIPLF